MEKKQLKNKKQKVQTHVPSQASPQTLPMGLNFLVFLFFLVFSRFWPNCKKPWKNKKNKKKSSDPCPLPGLSPDLAHGSELFVFFVFFVFSRFWPNCKKQWKNQKNKKFRPMSPARPLPDLAHGSELFFVFSIVVLNVFHVKMLSSQYLSKKCASLQFAHLRPPGQTAKKTMEKPKFINDLYND